MSAFMVEDKTINRVASNLYSNREGNWTRRQIEKAFGIPADGTNRDENARQLGQLMFALNVRGVNCRYGEGEADKFRPLTYTYQYETTRKLQVLKSLRCWLDQCNEGDTDEQTLYKIMDEYADSLAYSIVSDLPAYDQAEWG